MYIRIFGPIFRKPVEVPSGSWLDLRNFRLNAPVLRTDRFENWIIFSRPLHSYLFTFEHSFPPTSYMKDNEISPSLSNIIHINYHITEKLESFISIIRPKHLQRRWKKFFCFFISNDGTCYQKYIQILAKQLEIGWVVLPCQYII
jgi:hypothetical protein